VDINSDSRRASGGYSGSIHDKATKGE